MIIKPEHIILNEVRLAASQAGYITYRNNVGAAWQGEVKVVDDYVMIRNPRRVVYGLKKGSSDLIGYRPTIITPDMIGQTVAIFTAVEVKTENGRLTRDQQAFLKLTKQNGGIAVVARSPMDIK